MNKITTVCNTLVYKRYELSEKCRQECLAIRKLESLIPNNIPCMIYEGSDLCVFDYIEGKELIEINNINLISREAGLIVAEIFNKLKPSKKDLDKCWKNNLDKLIFNFENNLNQLKIYGKYSDLKNILLDLKIIKNKKSIIDNLTLVHRDIHLGNILYKEGKYILIDFEHSMEGPIELELQNSIFWSDDKSLNVNVVVNTLRDKGIPYLKGNEKILKSFYIADQLNIALKENNAEKIKFIMKNIWG